MNIEALIILGVAYGVEIVRHILDNRAHARQVRELCNRLQAGTLQDYSYNAPIEQNHALPVPAVTPPVVDVTKVFADIMSEHDLQQGQTNFNKLLDGR